MRKYATTIAGSAFTVAVVAIVAARGPDPHELPPGATLAAAASTGAEAAHPSTPAAMPAPQQLAAIAPPDAQPAASNSALLATERLVGWPEHRVNLGQRRVALGCERGELALGLLKLRACHLVA